MASSSKSACDNALFDLEDINKFIDHPDLETLSKHSAKKRKRNTKVVDVEQFYNTDPREIKKRIEMAVQAATTHLVDMVEDARKDVEAEFTDKEDSWADTVQEVIQNNTMLRRRLKRCKQQFKKSREIMMERARILAAKAVLEAKIKMVAQHKSPFFDGWDEEEDYWNLSLTKLDKDFEILAAQVDEEEEDEDEDEEENKNSDSFCV